MAQDAARTPVSCGPKTGTAKKQNSASRPKVSFSIHWKLRRQEVTPPPRALQTAARQLRPRRLHTSACLQVWRRAPRHSMKTLRQHRRG